MLYVNKSDCRIVIKNVAMNGRSYLETLRDESGIHFVTDSESDCFSAIVGCLKFEVFVTDDGIRVRIVAGDVITCNHFYAHNFVDGYAAIPDTYDIHAHILGIYAESTERFPLCDSMDRKLGMQYITVTRRLVCDGVKIVEAFYYLTYNRVEGDQRWYATDKELGTKGTTGDRMLARLRKNARYFQDQGNKNFNRTVERSINTTLIAQNREKVRSVSAGIKGFDPLYEYYDHVTMQVDVMPHQLEALAAFVRTLDQPG